ncbi:MAG: hypothetical protein QOH88_3502 [Verrucomicrobiota bacterium]
MRAVGFFPNFAVNTPKTIIGASVVLLALSAVVGFLNTQKTRALRTEVAQSETSRKDAEQLSARREKNLKEREAAVAAANAKFGDTRTQSAGAESELHKAQTEKSDLQAKLRANETEIIELRKRIAEVEKKPPTTDAPPSTSSAAELQAQLDEARKQLDAAEREKSLLSDKIKATRDRTTTTQTVETEKKKRPLGGGNPGIRGTVLAVNQAYNFVVLNLGGRQGVEPNSEMLVLRGGSLIGKIRISSVEPATAIGDIISSSLARGVQVQPGDTVVYAGNNS